MAVRTGAGTGVVVSLVVFVLTTVFLLVLTIVFYAGKTRELEAKAAAQGTLTNYVKSNESNSDQFKAFEAAAKQNGQSVAGYLNNRYEEAMQFVTGDPASGIEKLKAEMSKYGVKEDSTVRARMQELQSGMSAAQSQIEGLNNQLADLTAQSAAKDQQLAQAKAAHAAEVAEVLSRIESYKTAGDEYRQRLDEAIDSINKAKDELASSYETRVNELENENDELGREVNMLKGRVNEFERILADSRRRADNPALQVDGKIIDVPGSSDQIFIDRGKKDHIVLGMTFEVYGNESQIVVNRQTGEIPRGKASLEVTKVNDTTSTCKVTRSIPGQPIVRGDVLANAVYDPRYEFKFLVHGKFDIDTDGKPTETEAEYIRATVIKWGGAVVTGSELPGDLDFLVLGAEPPKPPPLPADAPVSLINNAIKMNEAHELYSSLFRQAREAQIPVLNANRFFILIGHTDR